jgi:tetratricopeptide (TPR) repeat protein
LCRQQPLHEQAHGQLMLALYRAGRQGDALAAYQRLRRTLDEELGVSPSQPLRELETAILRQDPTLDAPPALRPTAAPPPASVMAGMVAAQLPPAIAAFTGRSRELAQLDGLLDGAGGNGAGPARPAAVVISAISGTAGVGKTALAMHWAHRVAVRFPDGQLYANLRGFDPSGSVLDPAEAVRGFLDALGVPVERIPAGLDAQAGLYRSLLASKRVLVVLDNARDVEQVRPLLPGAPGCLVVVTSRNQLTGLVAGEGAHSLTVDLLSTVEARDLVARRLGTDRAAAEPDAVEEVIARCARLPLALAIACARAATRPGFPLAALAAELREASATLDALDDGDPASDVRAVFSWSYRALSTDAARLFRLLGLHPGPDLTAAAAASLAGIPPEQARTLLGELARARLLAEHTPGRYAFHDLLRAYAAEQAHAHDSADVRRAATQRMLDHYLHTAHSAALLLRPHWDPIAPAPPTPGIVPERLEGHDHALAWFTAEHPVLLAAVEQAAAAGFEAHTWQLAWAVTPFLLRRAYWAEQAVMQRAALDAARRAGDAVGQAYALQALALGEARSGRLDNADTHFRHALHLYADLADPNGQAHAHTCLALVAELEGRPDDVLEHALQALELFRGAGNRFWQANALNGVGSGHALLGNGHQALAYCTQALAVMQELGDREGQAGAWDSLGHAHRRLGDHAQAASCYQRAVDLHRVLGDRYYEADTLASLGDTHHAAGNPDDARSAWWQALGILDELGHPDADQLRAKLRHVSYAPPNPTIGRLRPARALTCQVATAPCADPLGVAGAAVWCSPCGSRCSAAAAPGRRRARRAAATWLSTTASGCSSTLATRPCRGSCNTPPPTRSTRCSSATGTPTTAPTSTRCCARGHCATTRRRRCRCTPCRAPWTRCLPSTAQGCWTPPTCCASSPPAAAWRSARFAPRPARCRTSCPTPASGWQPATGSWPTPATAARAPRWWNSPVTRTCWWPRPATLTGFQRTRGASCPARARQASGPPTLGRGACC